MIDSAAGSRLTSLECLKNSVTSNKIFSDRRQETPASIRTAQPASEIFLTDASGFVSNYFQNNDTESLDNEDEDDNGDDWLETALLVAAGEDLELAAVLISTIPRELMLAARAKGSSWQNTAAGGDGIPCERQQSDLNSPAGGVPTFQRKRRKVSNPNSGKKEKEDNSEDEEDKGGNDSNNFSQEASESAPHLLACPFHKLDSIKYGIHSAYTSSGGNTRDYRTCAGPGFKTIQRLKCVPHIPLSIQDIQTNPSREHLKRNHSPVQCDRCYEIFEGPDRVSCMNKLTKHRQLGVPCERRNPAAKEGISESQCKNARTTKKSIESQSGLKSGQ